MTETLQTVGRVLTLGFEKLLFAVDPGYATVDRATALAEGGFELAVTPLREILRDSEFLTLCTATVKDVRDHNPQCRTCPYVSRCAGGCRNSVLMQSDDYYGIDKDLCHFFENGWEERLTRAIEGPFRMYLQRNPPTGVTRGREA